MNTCIAPHPESLQADQSIARLSRWGEPIRSAFARSTLHRCATCTSAADLLEMLREPAELASELQCSADLDDLLIEPGESPVAPIRRCEDCSFGVFGYDNQRRRVFCLACGFDFVPEYDGP